MICEEVSTSLLNDRYISAVDSPVCLTTTGSMRLRRQDAAHLIDLRQHVGDGAVGVGVEAQVERHRADVLPRGRGQRVDAFGAGDGLLDGTVMKPLITSALAPG